MEPPEMSQKADSDTLSEAETARRSEAALKRMLSTPPKHHAPLKKKPKPSRAKAASRKAKKRA